MGMAGKTVAAGFQGADEVEAQQREVRQIVRGEVFAGQVRVDQTESAETAGGGAKTLQGRDQDVVVRPDDDVSDLTPAGDQQPDLTVDLAGEFRERPGQLVGDDPLRRDAPPVQLADPLDLCRSETGQVAVNLFDGRSFSGMKDGKSKVLYLNFCGLTRFSIRSRKVDHAFVRKAAARFRTSLTPQAGHRGAFSPTFMIRSKRWPQAVQWYS